MLDYNQTQKSSYYGLATEAFWGKEFGLLLSYEGGFTSSFAVGSTSFPMKYYTGFAFEGFAGVGYYKTIDKLYYLIGGGVGIESTSITVNVNYLGAGLPYYYSFSIGPAVSASIGYKITEYLAFYTGLKSMYGFKQVIASYEKYVENPFLITPIIGIGIIR